MNPDTQNPTQEPEQNGGTSDMPQAPQTGAGDDTNPAPTPTTPSGDNGDEGDQQTPQAPEAPAGDNAPEAPEAPAADEEDKHDGAKW